MHLWSKIEPHSEQVQGAEAVFASRYGVGWYLRPHQTVSAIRLWNSDQQRWHIWMCHPLDIRGARRRFERKMIELLSRYIPHDINGKLMGMDGILDSWKDSAVDVPAVMEDVKLIRESLVPLRKLSEVFSWLFKEEVSQNRAFTLHELQDTFSEVLGRLFKPSNTFQIHAFDAADPHNISVLTSPHVIVFWFFLLGILLATLKQTEENVALSFNTAEDHQHLIFRLKCRALPMYFESSMKQTPEIIRDLWQLLAYQTATWQRREDGIELKIPLNAFSRSTAQIVAFGSPAELNLSQDSLQVVPSDLFPEAIEVFAEHLSSMRQIAFGASSPLREKMMQLLASVRGVDELKFES
ncbi:MAG: hypothetical protein ACOY3I_09640 [Verrucomicrobiota bacterium]